MAVMYNDMVGHGQSRENEVTEKKYRQEGGRVTGNESGSK